MRVRWIVGGVVKTLSVGMVPVTGRLNRVRSALRIVVHVENLQHRALGAEERNVLEIGRAHV